MSDILPQHRTPTSRIIAALERPESDATSVGKPGIGTAADVLPYVQAAITALGAGRVPLRSMPGGLTGPRQLTPAQRQQALENHEFQVIPGGGNASAEATNLANNRFLDNMTARIIEALGRQQEVQANPHIVHGNANLGDPVALASGLFGDRVHMRSRVPLTNPRQYGLNSQFLRE